MNPLYIYRTETEKDFGRVENLTREAFWNVYQPGCEEHYILHVLRGDPAVIPELNLLCEAAGEIVGHIFYTRSQVHSEDGTRYPVITFGPISVRPDMQGQGDRFRPHSADACPRGGDGIPRRRHHGQSRLLQPLRLSSRLRLRHPL